MPPLPRFGPPIDAAEMRQAATLVAAAFAGELDAMHGWLRDAGADNVRVLRGRDGPAASLVLYEMGQYFGGRSVPCRGIAGVSVPTHARGKGLAHELLAAQLTEQHQAGPPLAALYPAAQHLYRGLGYGLAGQRTILRLRAAELPPAKAARDTREMRADDWPRVRALYAAMHATGSGALDRSPVLWERLRAANPQGVIIEKRGRPEGYLLFTLARMPGVLRFNMQVRDWAATTPHALQTVASLLYAQRSVVRDIQLPLAPDDPLLPLVTQDHTLRVQDSMLWMLRLVRVPDALAARGWPAIDAEAAFTVTDPLLPANNRAWRIRWRDGEAAITPARSARTGIDVSGLAALFTGFASPAALRRAGLLTGDDRHDRTLATLFASPTPHMPDFF